MQGLRLAKLMTASLLFFLLAGCSSAYYGAMEKVGIHKRDILADRIESASDAQRDAQGQFKDALTQFMSVVEVKPSELSDTYKKLSSAYEDSAASAAEINSRINSIEDVAEALFDEWQDELNQYSSASLRQASAVKLKDTRRQYEQLIKTMRKAENSMKPVLATMKDQTLYLKHNLNANAISAIKSELATIQKNVNHLNSQMQQSIDEANRFIAKLQQQ